MSDQSPLDAFMKTLHESRAERPPDSSIHRHVHASEGYANTDAATKRDNRVSRIVTFPATPEPGSHNWWVSQWRDLATVTDGLLPDDARVGPVLSRLAECDRCYKAADLDGFTKGAERVRRLMHFVPGATVRWEGTANHRVTTLGPATVEHVHHDQGRLWVWVSWRGTGRWISETIITKIEGPK